MAQHNKKMTRKEAIRRRNTFVAALALFVILIIVVLVVLLTTNKSDKTAGGNNVSSTSSVSSEKKEESAMGHISSVEASSNASDSQNSSSASSQTSSASSQSSSSKSSSSVSANSSSQNSSSKISKPKKELDPNFTDLLLVNGKNLLPKNNAYEKNLTIIEDKYLCGHRNRMNADVYPYAIAMVEAAWADGVDLYILSPYRSYDSQVTLFKQEVNEWLNGWCECHKWNKKKNNCQKTITKALAEEKASTEVARPGTSEHHTGMAIDFNSVSPNFENTKMYKWLDKNAQDYGFILRYTKDKQSITGVIHEPWHWRFVGINKAKEIKASGLCLEEYLGQ